MASTFSQIKKGLDEISEKNSQGRIWIANSRTRLVNGQSMLGGMQSEYADLVADINQAAIDNPTDDDYLTAKSEKDKLVADFLALKTYVDALIAALDGVSE